MRKLFSRLAAVHFPAWTFPLALLGLTGLAYGVLLPWLGFYWDDWAFTWISDKLGPAGLTRYFATNRPYWGLLYRLTTSALGSAPWQWQVFGLVWRWISALSLWWFLRLLFPTRTRLAAWTAILFAVYPGFDQQPIAITYGHFWIILSAFLLSLSFTVLGMRNPRSRLLYTGLALALSFINLLTMEYFFLLELLRPLVIWFFLGQLEALAGSDLAPAPAQKGRGKVFALRAFLFGQGQGMSLSQSLKTRLRETAVEWLPYLALFLGMTVWRAFFFRYQTQNYDPKFLQTLQSQPLAALLGLAGTAMSDLYRVTIAAWARAFQLPDVTALGRLTSLLYGGVTLGAFALAFVYLLRLRAEDDRGGGLRQAGLLALAALLLAGGPFWLTGLQIGLGFPSSRFTVPFMLGSSLLLAALLEAAPLKTWMKAGLLALIVGFAVGYQFQVASDYRRDWNLQKTLFWQMSWRMPGIAPGTTLLANDLPSQHVSDNSLTSPLNLIFAPENRSAEMSLMLYYPTVRLERGLKTMEADSPIAQNYLAATFHGSTSQVVAFSFSPPGCLRVLDPDLDPLNAMLPELMRSAASLSSGQWIRQDPQDPAQPPAQIFGEEPARSWCYAFERASLAAQQGDWQQVAALGDEAFALGDYPNDPMERVPFIEGYAHTGNWPRAQELTAEARDITPLMQPVLCRLWQRIDEQVQSGGGKGKAVQAVREDLGCS